MNPKGVVTCIPSMDLDRSLEFYRECFHLPDLTIEEDILTIELTGLSLFIMGQKSFESYTRLVGMTAHFPKTSTNCIFSCAIEDRAEVEGILASAAQHGGQAVQPLLPNQWGQDVAYVRDPDGHVWELVLIPES